LIVTGGTGFLGSAFVRRAIQDGARVTLLCRESADHWRLTDVAARYTTIRAPLDGLSVLSLPREHGRTMVHFAAAGVNQRFDDLEELIAVNVGGTAGALQFAVANGVRRFVLLGSSGEYGTGQNLTEDAPLNPTSPYGATRAAATLLTRAIGAGRGLDVVVVRPFAVYGPYEAAYRLIPYCIARGLSGENIKISSGDQTRDYVHVEDVADGIARACTAETAAGGVFNLCSGIETAVRDVAVLIAQLCGGRSAVQAGARPPIPGEMWRTSGNASRAHELLGWNPRRTLQSGLVETIGWFRDVGSSLSAYRLPG
jgi:nucleoside-diphosphate-sugar epimerase